MLGLSLLGVGVVLMEPPAPATSVFKGYLIYDEELHAFYPCEGAAPVSVSFPSNVDIGARYRLLKQEIREPIYFEVKGILTENRQFGFGLGQSWDQNLEIFELLTAYRIERINCGAEADVPPSWSSQA